MKGVDVKLSQEKMRRLETAQQALKKIKGFSFSLKRIPRQGEDQFVLSSTYQLPLKSLTVKNNSYSPDQELKLQLHQEKIISVFSKVLSRPQQSLIPQKECQSGPNTWKLSADLKTLILKTEKAGRLFYVASNFDNAENLTDAYYKSVKSAVKKLKIGGMKIRKTTTYKHEAKLNIHPVE